MRFLIPSSVRDRDLHRMQNAVLFIHKPIAIPEMTLFLFQMAILAAAMSYCSGKMSAASEVWKQTYMRSTTKKEAAVKAV